MLFFFLAELYTTTGWTHEQRARLLCSAAYRFIPSGSFPPQLLRVPGARPLAPNDPLAYPFRSTTTQPRYTIGHYLGHSTTGFCSRFANKPTSSFPLLNDPGAIQRLLARWLSHTNHYNRWADRPTFSLPTPDGPGIIATDDYFGPPTPAIPTTAPACTPRAQGRSPPRSPPTSSSTNFNQMLQPQPPRQHTQSRKT